MKSATKFAIATVAAALMGSSALAADLGGSCCADLEERIAELEATTVRKGNRKVSVQISGFVGHQVMFWDDGASSDMYIGDGGNIFSRWRLRGSAKINPDLEAGFLYEFGLNNNAISSMNQIMGADGLNGDDLGGSATGFGTIRDSTVFLKHKRLGMVKIGHGSTATDNLVLIDLGNRSAAGTPDIGLYQGSFRLTQNGGISGANNADINAVTWNDVTRGGETWDTTRRNHVLYETPSLAGFTLQAAVAEDNYWDVALRYAGEFNGVRVAFGIGYQENSEFNHRAFPLSAFAHASVAAFPTAATAAGTPSACSAENDCSMTESQFKGSASILHVATGLFMTGAWGTREVENQTSLGIPLNRTLVGGGLAGNVDSDSDFFHLAGGVSKNFFGIGNTVLFAEYSEANDAARVVFSDVLSSSSTHWGLGINQYIDASATQVFLTYKSFEADVNTTAGRINGLGDMSIVLAGMRVDF